jgi:hypothetical protein
MQLFGWLGAFYYQKHGCILSSGKKHVVFLHQNIQEYGPIIFPNVATSTSWEWRRLDLTGKFGNCTQEILKI